MKKHPTKKPVTAPPAAYTGLIGGIGELLETARHATARAVNSLMTATYWEVGRRIVKFEQGGKKRAGYGEELLSRLAADLTVRFGRGFSKPNLERMRLLYEMFPVARITSTVSRQFQPPRPITSTPSSLSAGRAGTGDSTGATASVDFLRTEPGAFSLADVAKSLPIAMVPLRPAAQVPQRRGIRLLPHRGPARRLKRAPTRPADQLALLRAHGLFQKQAHGAIEWVKPTKK